MTPVTRWQRLRLDSAVSRAWTRDGNLRLGFDLEITHLPHQVAQWLTLFDGTRDAHQLLESAAAMGIAPNVATETLSALAHHGLIYQVDVLPAALGDTRIHCDARVTGQTLQMTATEVALLRQTTRLLVVGAGIVSFTLVRGFEQLGYLCGWEINEQHRVTSDEAQLAQLPSSWINTKWREHRRVIEEPQLVLVVGDIVDLDQVSLRYSSALVLPIQVRLKNCSIGPLLHHPQSVCERCISASFCEDDWNLLMTQWLHHKRSLPLITVSMLESVSATAIAVVHEIVTRNSSELVQQIMTLRPPRAIWELTSLVRGIAADCQCQLVLV